MASPVQKTVYLMLIKGSTSLTIIMAKKQKAISTFNHGIEGMQERTSETEQLKKVFRNMYKKDKREVEEGKGDPIYGDRRRTNSEW